jgi:predicted RNA binding protein YcfA (HicA-like mRNA interferase family)
MPKLSPVHYKQLVKVFESAGFKQVREEGDHMVFTKAGVSRPLVIPKYTSVPVFIIVHHQKQSPNCGHLSRAFSPASGRRVMFKNRTGLTGAVDRT